MTLTLAVLAVVVLIELFGIKYNKDIDHNFLDLTTSNVIKGILSLIVIFIHIPVQYTNSVQDMIGSFGFVAVTMFFMLSAYGLCISMKTKQNYLQHFFRKRILVIIIPFAISVLVKLLCGVDWRSGGVMFLLILLMFYLVFYMVNKPVKLKHKNLIVILFVCLYSLLGYLFIKDSFLGRNGFSWYYESLGFVYGIILAKYQDKLAAFFKKNYFLKLFVFAFLSAFAGVLYLKFKHVYFFGEYLLKCVLGIIIIMFIMAILIHFRPGNKASVLLGKISFETFLYHGFVIEMLSKLSLKSSGIFIASTIMLTIILAFFIHRLDTFIIKRIKK